MLANFLQYFVANFAGWRILGMAVAFKAILKIYLIVCPQIILLWWVMLEEEILSSDQYLFNN